MKDNKFNIFSTSALSFIFLIGIVSMFSDLTHEGATSVLGPYLSLTGATAAYIGFVSGLGELIAHALRLLTGYITDRSKKYWSLTIVGYCMDLFSIPLLALIPKGGYKWALLLIIVQKTGKAIKKPAKDTILSFAATQEGPGKSFAIQEALDQFGAFLGPLLVFSILYYRNVVSIGLTAYRHAFFILGIPALITIGLLIFAKTKFPNPENFEPDIAEAPLKDNALNKSMLFYLVGIGFFAAGFIDYSLISMHLYKNLVNTEFLIPLIYSIAMAVDAFAALFFGKYFDKKGLLSVIISTICSAAFAIPIFLSNNISLQLFGIVLWGIGMGTQESVMKAVISKYIPKKSRAMGFGIFQTVFGIFWFFGSWIMGALYDMNIRIMVLFSVTMQVLAILFFIISKKSISNRHLTK